MIDIWKNICAVVSFTSMSSLFNRALTQRSQRFLKPEWAKQSCCMTFNKRSSESRIIVPESCLTFKNVSVNKLTKRVEVVPFYYRGENNPFEL